MRAGVELALAAGAFGQQVTVVVSGRACELLDKTVHTDESLYKLIGALPYYEIPRVHILSEETPRTPLRDDLEICVMTHQQWSDIARSSDIAVTY